ncbi:MAG TPA: hypothetical protein VM490_04810 [Armatimonadaceae bacterium]|nr:hypothetical protein [Armatimonadaceae bacterium]
MSYLRNGKEVLCDGPGVDACGCPARASLPVALSSTRPARGAAAILGWVFVADGGSTRHYCPACANAYPRLLDGNAAAAGADALPTLLRDA